MSILTAEWLNFTKAHLKWLHMISTGQQSHTEHYPDIPDNITGKTAKRFMPVYLVCSPLSKKKRELQFNSLFGRDLSDIRKQIDPNLVFFDEQQARHYAHFMDDSHGILKVFLPENAIQGQYENLSIKRDEVQAQYIHGCFPGWAKGDAYCTNPDFDASILTPRETVTR